jgi:hypothetical protein
VLRTEASLSGCAICRSLSGKQRPDAYNIVFWLKTLFFCKRHNPGGSNIVLALQTLFFGLKQNLGGSNIVFWEKTMFEGMGGKNRAGGDEIREDTPGIFPAARSSRWIAGKPRNFTGHGNRGQSRMFPPAKA